jgi:NADH:ubiquinone oxidoreductase subunit 6 (subunit J)
VVVVVETVVEVVVVVVVAVSLVPQAESPKTKSPSHTRTRFFFIISLLFAIDYTLSCSAVKLTNQREKATNSPQEISAITEPDDVFGNFHAVEQKFTSP